MVYILGAGQSRDWTGVAKKMFYLAPISTNSILILNNLLYAKYQENRDILKLNKMELLPQYEFEMDDELDLIKIVELKDLLGCIADAKNALEKYQINSYNNKPMQLIPFSIPKLIQRKWLKENNE